MQQKIFNGWRRPGANFPPSSLGSRPTMTAQGQVDLVQDVTSDCSVIASLCAVTARAERGHSHVGSIQPSEFSLLH